MLMFPIQRASQRQNATPKPPYLRIAGLLWSVFDTRCRNGIGAAQARDDSQGTTAPMVYAGNFRLPVNFRIRITEMVRLGACENRIALAAGNDLVASGANGVDCEVTVAPMSKGNERGHQRHSCKDGGLGNPCRLIFSQPEKSRNRKEEPVFL
jgi:hypothetical protein